MSPAKSWLDATVKMLDGRAMPQLQLGVYQMSHREATQATRWALEAGYRGIDSAQYYNNEKDVGKAVKAFLSSPSNTAGLKREDIFFTSKLASNSEYASVRRSISKSVKECELGYIDLFLLHSPYGGKQRRQESWRALEDAIQDGEIKSAGVSNFNIKHIEDLLESGRTVPAVNQIEIHPFNTRDYLTKYCADKQIIMQAYSPLARAQRMSHPTVQSLSKKYSCDPGQLMVKWSLQRGFVVLPKSVKKERIISNADVDNFEISSEDMKTLDLLDEELLTSWNPLDAD